MVAPRAVAHYPVLAFNTRDGTSLRQATLHSQPVLGPVSLTGQFRGMMGENHLVGFSRGTGMPDPMTVTAIPGPTDPQATARELEEARIRTLLLLAPLSDEDLRAQHDALMSPILWDLGHIAHFEELWLTHNLNGPIDFVEMPGLYNPFEHPRSERGTLPLPDLAHCREIMDEIRGRV